ncbi:MAG: DUF255 domain-containing protein [Acidobacteriota bacterium]|nr:DUF255 domain-containing protein [Blastocatellia bacterium]MDW8413810.1 DUF255 domain-containing protein [Acidobacteriota bacterium]
MSRFIFAAIVILIFQQPAFCSEKIKWLDWSDEIFKRAEREKRFILLDLKAVWCHWCHVMDKVTYSDPEVAALISEKFLAVRVDQDSRPDLSNRYEDYGWPATIFFHWDGSEIVKRSGYIPPKEMLSLLKAIIVDPSPGPSVKPEKPLSFSNRSSLPEKLKEQMLESFFESYDYELGGWGFVHKFLDWDCVEYAMRRAMAGDRRAEQMAKQTLKAQLQLLDPAWGGVYQYSAGGVWTEPHFEKIMSMQAENLRIYSQAYALWKDPVYLETAKSIRRYLKEFLTSPQGAFYTSQDADLVKGEHSEEYFKLDDKQRRKLGIPKVDTNIYSRENGWAINALTVFYSVSGDKEVLDSAIRAAEWIINNRAIEGGGFRHGEVDPAGPYLGDTLYMGRAFLSLYTVTGDEKWLDKAKKAADFIQANFAAEVGFATASVKCSAKFPPKPQRDENIALARFANLLYRNTGSKTYKDMTDHAMRYLTTEEIALRRPTAGVLLADEEYASGPMNIPVVSKEAKQ